MNAVQLRRFNMSTQEDRHLITTGKQPPAGYFPPIQRHHLWAGLTLFIALTLTRPDLRSSMRIFANGCTALGQRVHDAKDDKGITMIETPQLPEAVAIQQLDQRWV